MAKTSDESDGKTLFERLAEDAPAAGPGVFAGQPTRAETKTAAEPAQQSTPQTQPAPDTGADSGGSDNGGQSQDENGGQA